MIYLLDTNTCITYLKNPNTPIRTRLAAHRPNEIAVCSIVKLELREGALRSHNPVRSLAVQETFLRPFVSFPCDDAAATIAGTIRADLASKGTPIGPYDLLIAAIALAHQATLVSHNIREFSRVPGLLLEDWET